MVGIVTQVVLGRASHFNVATPFDGAIYSLMGTFIVVIWTMGFVTAVLLLRQRLENRAFAWGLRLGIVVSLLGMAVAFPMTTPTQQQLADTREMNAPMTTAGAHAVGAPDDGPALPVVGWSTLGGDLRVGHFVGLTPCRCCV